MSAKAYPKNASAYPQISSPKRGPLVVFLTGALLFVLFISTSSVSDASAAVKVAKEHANGPGISRPKLTALLPDVRYPFRQAAHEPPVQRNSTSGEAKWYSDWKWMNPFSSTITLDEHRSVLPPPAARPPIYTFYNTENEKTEEVRAAESKLLLTWRRAWWAQGFKPVILGRAEAMKNPLYETLQVKELTPALEAELMRWLAWGHMGSGVLANWLLLPMGAYDDHLLSYLRRGQYPRLTRYENLGSGLYSGDQPSIQAAIAIVLQSRKLTGAKSILEATSDPDMFAVDPKPSDLAFYDPGSLTALYKPITDALLTNQAQGLTLLLSLISSHLHTNFLNNYPSGFAVLSPHGSQSAVIFSQALAIAHSLNTCTESPVPRSCPPNMPACTPCSPLKINYPRSKSNDTTLFNIGTIPHPYTLAVLLAQRPDITVKYIRRDTERDRWLQIVTRDTLGTKLGGTNRIVSLKEEVAGETSAARGIWMTAEQNLQWRDLEWHFGFELPRADVSVQDVAASGTNVQMKMFTSSMKPQAPTEEALVQQKDIFAKAKQAISKAGKAGDKVDMKEVVEAWNLADTEAWRFVRAYEARGKMEWTSWEEEERKFIGGDDEEERGEGWGRWFDRA
ncbi:hypothetical protein MMC11_000985 [Xylographa trunciseda]|nr:hypothetical protein [Xylographa trunciseda]